MPGIVGATKQAEKLLLLKQRNLAREILKLFYDVTDRVSIIAATQRLPKGVFSLAKMHMLNEAVDRFLADMVIKLEIVIRNGIDEAWGIANVKNDGMVERLFKDYTISKADRSILYSTNPRALAAFQNRRVAGMNLSDRIWKLSQGFKDELEVGLADGIHRGVPAAQMARDLRQLLLEPDKVFRRVRNAKGELVLSKQAKAYHPGQGVYRSSLKNAMRLTRTETNMAYRNADVERWRTMPFILGYEVRISASHPKYDICDAMAGQYPKEFNFAGWHPHCLCFAVPVQMTTPQFMAYQKLVLAGTNTPENIAKIAKPVTEIPAAAAKWIRDNNERVQGWENPPYFFTQNTSFVKLALKQ